MRKIKNIVVLAGGDSSRFWPLEEKNLLPFLGKPLIIHQIEKLSEYADILTVVAGQTNIISIKRNIENSQFSAKCRVIVQKNLSGQAGAIMTVKGLLSGEALIVNANDVFDYTVLDKLLLFINKSKSTVFFGKNVNEYFPGGYFKFNMQNKIEKVIEKPEKNQVPSNVVKLVLDYYSDINDIINSIEKTKTDEDDLYERAINRLLSQEIDRELIIYEGNWQSLKFAWHILPMTKLFLSHLKKSVISSKAVISKNAIITGPVIIEEGVKIGDFVKITGPSYIGENTIVGDYSLIRESQVGSDCLVGSYSEVARSYIGNKVFLHRNYVGDSVLSDDSMMGAQAVTANFRFDSLGIKDTNLPKLGAIIGKQTKIGVNSTLIPGVKIGKNTWIAPGETVRDDIADKKYFVKGEEKDNLKV